ncbi:hypothetical protein C0J52_03031 [Blattella germanica]|nr:hypothetical protein C0J52_03031 [Blattella germanica]
MPNMVNFITHCDATNFPNKFREGANSKGVKVHIRSCGIDTFGAKDMCELIEAADGKDEVTKTLCKHCDEKLCNNHSRAISLSTETFAYYPLLCAVYWINR